MKDLSPPFIRARAGHLQSLFHKLPKRLLSSRPLLSSLPKLLEFSKLKPKDAFTKEVSNVSL